MALCFLLIKSMDVRLKAERFNDATVVLITLIYSMAIALNYSVLQCQHFSILLRDSDRKSQRSRKCIDSYYFRTIFTLQRKNNCLQHLEELVLLFPFGW